MLFTDVLDLYLSKDVQRLDAFCTGLGLTDHKITTLDIEPVHPGPSGRTAATYHYQPPFGSKPNPYNYICFTRQGDWETLDIQFNRRALFNTLFNDLLAHPDYEQYYPRYLKKAQSFHTFYFSEAAKLNVHLINNPPKRTTMYTQAYYGIVLSNSRKVDAVKIPGL